ncbi:putative Intraflagellar transport protein 81-like protein [Monocercomonoides exilis]|uniref:putative Intraflagellar transport protein 81-like protein n=1 Tax=Monocercomonoides exilis TaxID=2049356 RepID=UPI00355961C7|nr:putative Intraflagellar transport protein 81-like protein [Monocercomonoides exilis]|eukprot:MONOS_230.1-p1 / transcript=MONOS_230.1 / gene=MONOS_230 / organism=Monocercomonoides_exilis_PA203 / gene_product=Intraflagellar transport protein 81-like protein / transcript_product=Intraflagellar transport protein 81-like protein / location=Mono_scaffold00004:42435-44893(+) / protein_length=711 / sequence_SO=supercontig / SO=protein_coding / is_pseudo=false
MSLAQICENLKAPPFNRKVSQVQLSKQTHTEWLQLMSDICTTLNDEPSIDIRDELLPDTIARLVDFIVRILNYKSSMTTEEIQANLEENDKNTIYTITQWLLGNQPKHRRRLYLAKYLLRIEIPPDVLSQDTFLQELDGEYRGLMDQFKETHQAHTQATKGLEDPKPLEEKCAKQEEELDILQNQVDDMEKKISTIPKYLQLVTAEREYREALEEQAENQERDAEQRQQLNDAEKQLSHLQRKLAVPTSEPYLLFDQLHEEVEELRDTIETRLRDEVVRVQRQSDEMAEMLKGTQEGKEKDLERDVRVLEKEIDEKEKEKERREKEKERIKSLGSGAGVSGGDVYRQQGLVAEKKRLDALRRLNEKRADRVKLQQEVDKRRALVRASGGGADQRPVQDQIESVKSRLVAKHSEWKQEKQILDSLKAETAVLMRTEEILKEKDTDLEGFLDEEEAKRGIQGHRKRMEELEDVSRMKAETDEDKQAMLEEHTRTVQAIQELIQAKRGVLEPLSEKRRAARLKMSELSQERNAKKQTYDTLHMQLTSDESALRQRVGALREESMQLESDYHRALMQLKCLQVTQGKADGSIAPPDGFTTFKEMYEKKDPELKKMQARLRDQKKESAETFAANRRQLMILKDLYALLSAKQAAVRTQMLSSTSTMREKERDKGNSGIMATDYSSGGMADGIGGGELYGGFGADLDEPSGMDMDQF